MQRSSPAAVSAAVLVFLWAAVGLAAGGDFGQKIGAAFIQRQRALRLPLLLPESSLSLRGGASRAATLEAEAKIEGDEEDEDEGDGDEDEEAVKEGEEEEEEDEDEDEEIIDEDDTTVAVGEEDEDDEDVAQVEDGEEEEDEEEAEDALDPKLTAAAMKSSLKSKAKAFAEKASATKEAVNLKLAGSSGGTSILKGATQKKKSSLARFFKLPYIVRACLNPVTAFAMTKAFWASLFNLDYPPKDTSQDLRSSLEEKNRKAGGDTFTKPKRKMKRGQAKTLSDLPQLNT